MPPPPPAAERRRLLVTAALIEREGKILMSRRRADQSLPGCWEFPGGKIEAGESPEAALAREIEEELGCTVAVGAIFEVVFFAYEAFDLYMLVYRCADRGRHPQRPHGGGGGLVRARRHPRAAAAAGRLPAGAPAGGAQRVVKK